MKILHWTRWLLINTTGCLVCLPAAQAVEVAQVVFATGQVQQGKRLLTTGDWLQEGDGVQTGKDGYVYLKTVDKGFLILRPDSQATIVRYHIDSANPDNTRIKLELKQGVARHVSGEAVKAARQHFRFNTPVAAIGVRGTDFTVLTTAESSRVMVASGGVVVSGFGSGCTPDGQGPCSGRELFAHQQQMLQVQRGQEVPSLLNKAGSISPAGRSDEPQAKNSATSGSNAGGTGVGELNLQPIRSSELDVLGNSALQQQVKVAPDPSPDIMWGRWRPVLEQGVNIDLATLQATHRILAINNAYILLREYQAVPWETPSQGSAGFALQGGEAVILNEKTGQQLPGSFSNAQLQVNFATAHFSTSLDLKNPQGETWKLYAQGSVTRDGQLSGHYPFPNIANMAVQGAINNTSATYLFQSRLDDNQAASGVTVWRKQ